MLSRAVAPTDFRDLARRRLPRFLFDYMDGGSFGEHTLRRNVADLAEIELRQRVLKDVSEIDFATNLFGAKAALPVVLGPIGLAGMNARRGEVQAARAASQAGIPFCLSTVSVCPLEEVAAAGPSPWFQLYMIKDRAFMRDLLEKAKALGCSTLVFTVDMPVPGTRYRDYRSGLAGAPGITGAIRRFWQSATHPRWAWDVGLRGMPHHLGNVAPVLEGKTGLEDFFAWMRRNFDASVTWRDLDFILETWTGDLVIKGILDVDDASIAHQLGANGIVVSNHGGRQLDGATSTTRALQMIADRVGDSLTVLVDGGLRTGLDVVRMLALGADGVLLGRAWAFALAAQGEKGVSRLLAMIDAEMRVAMALIGKSRISDVDRSCIASH